ncbi:MAG: PAS domain S-box protein, partial [Thiohalomonadales bacterium]
NAKDTPGVVSRVITPDRWVRAFISPIKDNKGVLREVVLLYEDVTEKKYTDDAIRHIASGVSAVTGEVFFNHLVEHLAKIFDAEYAFIGILEKEDLERVSTLAVFAHGKIIENFSCSLQHSPGADTISKGTRTYPNDVRQRFPHDKLLIDWNIEGYISTPLFDSKGGPLGILVVLNDKPLTHVDQVGGLLEIFAARAGAELERLRAEEVARKLTMAVEQSPNSVIVTTKEGVIEYVNTSFTRLTGYSRGEAIGQTPRLFKSENQDVAIFQEMWHTVLAGRIWHGELENQRKDGSTYSEEQTIAPVYDEQEKITHFIAIKQDITERLQTEEALRRSQKMDAIGQLSGGIAHDFNNQLGVVIGYLDFLKGDYPEGEKQSEWIDIASKATLRCMDLTRQLLTFSRLQPKTKAVVDVNMSLKKIETMIGRTLTPAVEVKYSLCKDLWPVEVDIGEFEDTILNMVINARDAMQGDGNFTIETSNQFLDADFTSAYPWLQDGDYVQVALTDTGKGMSAEILEHVFEPFFTTKPEGKGTGLGMSMVYGFAKRCGGIVKIYSEPDLGTTVRIYLPRSSTNSAMNPVISRQADLPGGNETILIVDDELGLLDLAQHYLDDLGYKTQRAENAAQALQILQGDSKFDLLFSDVVMPGGVNGYQLAQQATEGCPGLRVLLTSGFASKSIEQQGLSHFSANMLNKPYRKVELANRIRLVLDEDRTEP